MKFCPSCSKSFDDANAFCPDDGEVLQESPETIVGQVIEGKYKIEGFIAQGGMGSVYRARHILLGDEVVIKTLRSEMRNNAEWLRRFQREGKAARAFRHPNSVTVYDLSAGTDGLIYMVMEYVEGHTLDKELKRRGRFTPAEALEVLEPVADVLDAAHARGVVHRDLKPENIMLGKTHSGHAIVKVLDLGIAKMVGAGEIHAAEATALTVAGQILGTPYYMSPEQWGELPRDGNAEVDGRTDIYSLGVIFFELVAGRKPLGGRTLSELRQKHVASPLPSLADVAPDVPEAFGSAVARAMAKDRGDRPQKAGELIAELRSALGLAPQGRSSGLVKLADAGQERQTDAGAEAATAHLSPRDGTGAVGASPVSTTPGPAREGTARQAGRPDTAANRSGAATGFDQASDSSRPTVLAGPTAETRAGYEDPVIRQTRVAAPTDNAAGNGVAVAPTPVPTPGPTPGPARPLGLFIAAAALALLLVAGAGGWLAWRALRGVRPDPQPDTPPVVNSSTQPDTPAPAPKVEAVSYWLEAFDSLEARSGETVADPAVTLPSGKRFVLHFRAPERGYLYIVGPGEGNAPTTFLTARGAMGLATNLLPAGAGFVFPPGGVKMRLDDRPGVDEFTVVFSPSPLLEPAFLTQESGRKLSPAEVRQLEDLRAQSAAGAPALEVKEDGGTRRVAVSVAQNGTGPAGPVVFDVRVNHK